MVVAVVIVVVVRAVVVVHMARLAVRRVEEVRLEAGNPLQIERMPAEDYLASSYYEKWFVAIERLLREKGVLP